MNTSHKPEFEISLEDDEAEASQHRLAVPESGDSDDLPVLTDVVDERIEPFIGDSEPIILEAVEPEPEPELQPPVLAPAPDLAGRIVELDIAIKRLIEDWVATELPQLVSRELDDLAERLRVKAVTQLQHSLLPLISAEIASRLDNDSEA
ncbi:MAG: hypothetical protein PHI64_15875 [Zoogloea sp.]|uniref:hypothetical protein n=1 Tax=Zoogloea sp. TaxID=49181 RepID=UPI002614850D|nr:hypothetical protein [Zoogloea sp.]MDD2990420.1 hypothetical protein [Zoogloea sp.]